MNEVIGWWTIAIFCNNKGLQCNYNDGDLYKDRGEK